MSDAVPPLPLLTQEQEGVPLPATLVTLEEVENARDEFLVELASFRLSMRKNTLVIDAEGRQAQQYKDEIESIAREHEATKLDIENLRLTLEQEQTFRKRKQEYDLVAEKINDYPSRTELTADIAALDDELSTIRAAREDHNENLAARRAVLDTLVQQIHSLRQMGKPQDGSDPTPGSAELAHGTHQLNPAARPNTTCPAPAVAKPESDDDIEMGEVAEEAEAGEVEDRDKWSKPKSKSRRPDDEMEEGEASDGTGEPIDS
ncbi:Tho complex subunit 7 [Rhizoctonia solani]|uniref:Tho complex subunit 7 n=1 Tax=Rhizoctonia solani TaxID=456999 RepID=A0A8H7M8T7_9AGAM|nr:Tho complex subunit 7 [Rhizoctonia solani]